MKSFYFDVVVGNPPYTQGAKPLYSDFFDIALDIGHIVAFLFPIDLTSNNKKLKKVNTNIKRHSISVSHDVSHHFKDVSQPNIRYVIASREVCNDVVKSVDPLKDRPVMHPTRNRIKVQRGSYKATTQAEKTSIGIRFVRAVLSTGVVEWTIDTKFKQDMFSEPYLVLINYSMAGGRLQCTIVENRDVVWSYTVFAVPCATLYEANSLQNWLSSKEVGDEMVDMMRIKNVYTFSEPMLSRLPTYK